MLACIPNGELSNLFNNNIIKNFKTYDYYTEQDRSDFKVHKIPDDKKTIIEQDEYVEYHCVDIKNFQRIDIEINNRTKPAYYDAKNSVVWWKTSHNNKPAIKAVRRGSTARIDNEILKNRYNSLNKQWIGYKEKQITFEKL